MSESEQHSTIPTVSIEIVRGNQKSILENLMMFYLYDLNAIAPNVFCMPLDANGRLEYPNLGRYWQEAGCHPYFIRLNAQPIGFCLVHQQPFYPLSAEQSGHVIGEFFVAKMYRGQGIGTLALQQVILQHPGDWEVRVIREHTQGQQFWQAAIDHLSPKRAEVWDVNDTKWDGLIYSFSTNNFSEN